MQVSGGKGSFANSADNRGDYLDEEAERQAFKEAVEEWRRQDAEIKTTTGGNKPCVRIDREYLSKGDGALSGSNDLWKDPFASNRDVRIMHETIALMSRDKFLSYVNYCILSYSSHVDSSDR